MVFEKKVEDSFLTWELSQIFCSVFFCKAHSFVNKVFLCVLISRILITLLCFLRSNHSRPNATLRAVPYMIYWWWKSITKINLQNCFINFHIDRLSCYDWKLMIVHVCTVQWQKISLMHFTSIDHSSVTSKHIIKSMWFIMMSVFWYMTKYISIMMMPYLATQ